MSHATTVVGAQQARRASVTPRSVATILAIAALAWLIQINGAFNHDTAFTIIGARTLLEGGAYGVDVVDPNPPLAYWLTVIPVAAGDALGVRPEAALIAFTTLLALGGLALASAVLTRTDMPVPGRRAFLTAAGIALLLLPGYHFGQREHLMLIGALPWIAATAGAYRGAAVPLHLRLCVGLAAGLAFCLKPHFLLVPIVVEIVVLLRTRRLGASLRAENLALVGFGLGYAAAIVLVAPAYLATVVPDAAAYYRVSDVSLPRLLLEMLIRLAPLATAAFILCRRTRPTPLARMFMAAAGAAALAALLQSKGWAYHWVPMLGFASLAGAALLFAPQDRSGRNRAVEVAAAALLGVAALSGAAADLLADRSHQGTRRGAQELAEAIVREGGAGATVFAFNTSPRVVHPAVLAADAKWSSPSCCLQWLAAAGPRDPAVTFPAATGSETNRKLAALLARLERDRPDLILIDDRERKLAFARRRFDYLPFLLGDARFRRIWAAYDERPGAAGFRIFARVDPAVSRATAR